MGFESLLGNDRLKENLSAGIQRGRISHFYLVSGPEGSGKRTLAKLLSAALLCREPMKPCLSCPACRKVMAQSHPDLITVLDPEHKNVAVKLVRQVRDDMFVRPNEADRKIYLFPQELGIEGQNALLKVLEEPPSYGVFILMTDNPEKILPTVRSRAVELGMSPLPSDVLKKAIEKEFPAADQETVAAAISRSGGYLGQAKALLQEGTDGDPGAEKFVKSYAAKDPIGLTELLVPMEKWKRDQALSVFVQWEALLQSALVCRSGAPVTSAFARELSTARSSAELLKGVRHLQKAIEYVQGNVSVAAVCGYLTWALRE